MLRFGAREIRASSPLLVVLLALACGDDGDSAAECARDVDCPKPAICESGSCIVRCSDDEDCPGEQVCRSETCVDEPDDVVAANEAFSDERCPARVQWEDYPVLCRPTELPTTGLSLEDPEGRRLELTISQGRILEVNGERCAQCTSAPPETHDGGNTSCVQRVRCGSCGYDLLADHTGLLGSPAVWRLRGDPTDPETCPEIPRGFVLATYTRCPTYCAGAECGSDGCGGACGSCPADRFCNGLGNCVPNANCQPSCEDRECGDDGCDGSCGDCIGTRFCLNGQCTLNCSPPACSECLSTCQGLPSCCTGTGCICDDECPC